MLGNPRIRDPSQKRSMQAIFHGILLKITFAIHSLVGLIIAHEG